MAIRLDLEICPVSKIRGKSGARRGIWILDGPSRFLETVQLSKIRGEARNLESGWPEPRSGKLVYSRNPGNPPPSSITVHCVRLGNSESWKVESAITLPVVSMHVSRTRNALATLHGHRARRRGNGLARARVQRAPRVARHRVGARSHPRRTG